MKKKNEKLFFAITGGALITASVIPMVAYLSSRKKEEQHAGVGMLLGAIAGMTAGILLAYEPRRRARRRVVVDQMFNDDDAEAANRKIDGVLNRNEERAANPESFRREIDVDEDASIEDFI